MKNKRPENRPTPSVTPTAAAKLRRGLRDRSRKTKESIPLRLTRHASHVISHKSCRIPHDAEPSDVSYH